MEGPIRREWEGEWNGGRGARATFQHRTWSPFSVTGHSCLCMFHVSSQKHLLYLHSVFSFSVFKTAMPRFSHLLAVCIFSICVSVPHALSEHAQSLFSFSNLAFNFLMHPDLSTLKNPDFVAIRFFLSHNINSTRWVSGRSNHSTQLIGQKEAHLGWFTLGWGSGIAAPSQLSSTLSPTSQLTTKTTKADLIMWNLNYTSPAPHKKLQLQLIPKPSLRYKSTCGSELQWEGDKTGGVFVTGKMECWTQEYCRKWRCSLQGFPFQQCCMMECGRVVNQ